jgi:hypothetical protein
MRVTITIDEEKEAEAGVRIERAETSEAVTTSAELPAEAKPTNAGGPPPWLLQELQGAAAEPEGAQTSIGPIDAGPAPVANGNGLASVLANVVRGS